MNANSQEDLRAIRFEGELLPGWAQVLDVAARLSPVPEETRQWFSLLTNSSGVDDSRTVLEHCELLRRSIEEHRESILAELKGDDNHGEAADILRAWIYALDTMIQEAQTHKTCSWIIEGPASTAGDDWQHGDVGLRRV